MVKKRYIASFAAALIIIIATLLIVGESNQSKQKTINIDLYYFNEENTALVSENRDIEYEDRDELIETVLDKLLKGPSDSKNKPLFNTEVQVKSISVDDKDVTIDFSEDYLTKDDSRDSLTVYAISKSLCQLKTVRRVKITVEGEEIISSDGTTLGFLSNDDMDFESDTVTKDSKVLTLYFADKDSDKLVKEKRTIKITDTVPTEQYVVNELIKGTKYPDKERNIISSDTILVSAQTTDNTCFVNFKSGFVEKNTGNSKNEELVIYSIVNSLCEIKGVDFVQFLIDGKKIEKFGDMKFTDFFIMNNDIIK